MHRSFRTQSLERAQKHVQDHLPPTYSAAIRVSFSPHKTTVRFKSDSDFGQFKRLARSVALQNTFDRPRSTPVSTILNEKTKLQIDTDAGKRRPRPRRARGGAAPKTASSPRSAYDVSRDSLVKYLWVSLEYLKSASLATRSLLDSRVSSRASAWIVTSRDTSRRSSKCNAL